MISREQALALLKAQNPDDYLWQHSLSSEAIMRALAPSFGGNEEAWGICGLLHDVDFMETKNAPEKHGLVAKNLLEQEGLDTPYVYAIAAHNSEYTGHEPKEPLDYALRCAETITGLISAAALIRPDGMQGMQAKSIKKKMKDKSFAAAVSRERIKECEKINLSLDDFITISINAMEQALK